MPDPLEPNINPNLETYLRYATNLSNLVFSTDSYSTIGGPTVPAPVPSSSSVNFVIRRISAPGGTSPRHPDDPCWSRLGGRSLVLAPHSPLPEVSPRASALWAHLRSFDACLQQLYIPEFDFRGLPVLPHSITLRSCNLKGANFNGVNLGRGSVFSDCNFAGADLRGFAYQGSQFTRCTLNGALLDEGCSLSLREQAAQVPDPLPEVVERCSLCMGVAIDQHICSNGTIWCLNCWDECHTTCAACDAPVERDPMNLVPGIPDYYCNAHRGEAMPVIASYSLKPVPTFYGSESDKALREAWVAAEAKKIKVNGGRTIPTPDECPLLYFGTEVEVEGPNGDRNSRSDRSQMAKLDKFAKQVASDKFFYCKADSSIDYGFEIVSHPFTWNWFKEQGDKIIKPKFLALVKAGFRSHDTHTCGMHVHMTRDAFGFQSLPKRARSNQVRIPHVHTGEVIHAEGRREVGSPHLYRFSRFFVNNPDFILFMSRRRPDRMANYAPIQGVHECAQYSKQGVVGGTRGAVNMRNEKTVEVRMFRGTLNWAGYCRNLEFCHALWQFTKITCNGLLDYEDFLRFLADPNYTGHYTAAPFDFQKEHRKRSHKKEFVHPMYPNLYEFLLRAAVTREAVAVPSNEV